MSSEKRGISFNYFLVLEREEIKKYKWIRGEQLGYDPGERAVIEWVNCFADEYRDFIENKYGGIY